MEGRGAMWLVAGPLIALKVWATVILLVYAPTRDALHMALATGWPWLVVVAALVAAPTLAWYRLVRARARRERLRRAEWMLDEPSAAEPAARRSADPTQWPDWVTVVRSDGGS